MYYSHKRPKVGGITAALSKHLPAHYLPKTVKAIALENCVILAHEMNIPWVIIESDSLSTVQSVNAKKKGRVLGHIFRGIQSSLLHFCSWSLHHLKRDHKRAAHELA